MKNIKSFLIQDNSNLKEKNMSDISLNSKAKEKAFSLYENSYKKSHVKLFSISSSRCIIPKVTFIKILNDCFILSLQKIEDRLISTKFLFPSKEDDTFNWPKGVMFIPIEELSLNNIDLQNLKKFLEMAGDSNTFIVMDISENNQNESIFILKGFMFVEKSLNNLIFKSEQERIELKQENLEILLGCLYDSVIFSIDNGRVIASYLNEPFITIEKGTIFETPQFDVQGGLVTISSEGVKERLQNRLDRDDIPIMNRVVVNSLITNKISESLRNILLKIRSGRHGSTLIFNFDGDINDDKAFQPNAIKVKIPYGNSLLKLTELTDRESFSSNKAQQIYKTIEMYENAIISLSKTDGALIFNQFLDLVLVGAFLKSKISASLSGGARRKSAEGFVRDNQKTMSIIVSQDGNITFIGKLFENFLIIDGDIFSSI